MQCTVNYTCYNCPVQPTLPWVSFCSSLNQVVLCPMSYVPAKCSEFHHRVLLANSLLDPHYTELQCTKLHPNAFSSYALHYITPQCTTHHCTTHQYIQHTALHPNVSHTTELHYNVLHTTALQHNVLQRNYTTQHGNICLCIEQCTV